MAGIKPCGHTGPLRIGLVSPVVEYLITLLGSVGSWSGCEVLVDWCFFRTRLKNHGLELQQKVGFKHLCAILLLVTCSYMIFEQLCQFFLFSNYAQKTQITLLNRFDMVLCTPSLIPTHCSCSSHLGWMWWALWWMAVKVAQWNTHFCSKVYIDPPFIA